jgi:hypothetical protein
MRAQVIQMTQPELLQLAMATASLAGCLQHLAFVAGVDRQGLVMVNLSLPTVLGLQARLVNRLSKGGGSRLTVSVAEGMALLWCGDCFGDPWLVDAGAPRDYEPVVRKVVEPFDRMLPK